MMIQTLSQRPLHLIVGLGAIVGSGLTALVLALVLNAASVLALSGAALFYPAVVAMLGAGLLVILAMPALNGLGELEAPSMALNAADADQIVNSTLMQAMCQHADAVYLNPDEQSLHISFETGGLLQETTPAPRTLQAAIAARLKTMADLDVAQTENPQQGQLRLKSQGRLVSIRVATTPTARGEMIALHLSELAA